MKKPTVYIAGPIRGRDYYNWPAFEDACVMLEREGYEVCSPHRIDENVDGFNPYELPDDHDWWSWPESLPDMKTIIKRDIIAMLECDYIYLLDGWENSTGAQAEAAVARWAGLGFIDRDVPVPISAKYHNTEPEDTHKNTNPKDRIGSTKHGIDCIPLEVVSQLGLAMAEGAMKYGPFNWRDAGVRFSVYMNAIWRHVLAAWLGEWIDVDSGVPHMVKAMACCAVVVDAFDSGMLTHDGPEWRKSYDQCELLSVFNAKHKELRSRYGEAECKPSC